MGDTTEQSPTGQPTKRLSHEEIARAESKALIKESLKEDKATNELLDRIDRVESNQFEAYDTLQDEPGFKQDYDTFVEKFKNEGNDDSYEALSLATGQIYDPDREEELLAKYPELNSIRDKYSEKISTLRQITADVAELKGRAIEALLPETAGRIRYLKSHFDYSQVSNPHASANDVLDIAFLAERIPSDLDITFQYYSGYTKSDRKDAEFRAIFRAREGLKYLDEKLEGTYLIIDEVSTEPSEAEIAKAKEIFARANEAASYIQIMRSKVQFYTRTVMGNVYDETLAEGVSSYRQTEEGIPVTVVGNNRLMIAEAKRIEYELENSELFEFYDPAREVSEEEHAHAIRDIQTHADNVMRWEKLKKRHSYNLVLEFSSTMPITGFTADLQRDGKLPDFLTENPLIAVGIAARIKELRPQYERIGILPVQSKEVIEEIKPEQTPFSGTINGLEQKAGLELVLDEQVVRKSITEAFPTYFTQNLSEINFAESADLPPEVTTREDAENYKRDFEREWILGDLYHEVFEHIVDMLSMEEMQGYDAAIAQDVSNGKARHVSSYARKSSITSDELGDKEDFCDAGSMFLTKPANLYLISPERYKFMVELFASHMPEDAAGKYRHYHYSKITEAVNMLASQEVIDYTPVDSTTKVLVTTVQELALRAHELAGDSDYRQEQASSKWTTVGRYEPEGLKNGKPAGKINIYMSPYLTVI